ncbi:DUF1735 domain-containing protein [Mucilaginibacter sp. Mucisp86]|uniref:DUF1735 domain-containing protein n=1 Tax=Mucilaginibacter sp. Mucisp86 TaxID=3243060 RepID=UPI0039B3F1D8
MKTRLYIKLALAALVTMTAFSSCLKDDKHYVDFAGAKPLVELPSAANVGGSGGLFQPVAFDISSTPIPLNLMVNLAAPHTLSSNLTVKLSVDQAALTKYNTDNETSYELLPAEDYTSTLSVVIPANQNSANLVINFKTNLIDPSKDYALPITITDGGGQQISNYKTVIFNVQVKNKYDGIYTVTGTLSDNTSPAFSGAYPYKVGLVTQGAVSNGYFDEDAGSFLHKILNAGAPSSYGEFAPIFTFDPATNKITGVTNLYGNPSPSRIRGARLDPTGVNAFTTGTPGTVGSVFKVKYIMTQGGADRTTFDETFTYKSKR